MSEGSELTVEITDENFDDITQENDRVVLDLWASWCAPCKMMEPVIEELAEKYDGKITFGKMNTEENPQIPNRYGVQAIPLFLLVSNGEVVDQVRGALPEEEMEKQIKKAFGL